MQLNSGLIGQSENRHWYSLYTRHQHEKTVARILEDKGFDIFLPVFTAKHRWQDRRKHVLLPLFPSYVFLHGGLERWERIVTTPGIYSVVTSGGRPAVIPEAEIEGVRKMIQSPFPLAPYPFLKNGDWARVKSGPLLGLEGILVHRKKGSRLVLSVEMLGKSAAVEVDDSMVERIPARVSSRAGSTSQPGKPEIATAS